MRSPRKLNESSIPYFGPEQLGYRSGSEEGAPITRETCKQEGVLCRMQDLEGRECLLPIDRIYARRDQPRQWKSDAEVKGGMDQLQAIQVVPFKSNDGVMCFLIVDGEERWTRAKDENKSTIKAIIAWDASLNSLFLKALVSNEARTPLNPVDAAHAYRRAIGILASIGFGHNEVDRVEKIAKDTQKKVDYIRDRLKLLGLIQDLQELLGEGVLNVAQGLKILNSPYKLAARQKVLLARLQAIIKDGKIRTRDLDRELEIPLDEEGPLVEVPASEASSANAAEAISPEESVVTDEKKTGSKPHTSEKRGPSHNRREISPGRQARHLVIALNRVASLAENLRGEMSAIPTGTRAELKGALNQAEQPLAKLRVALSD